MTAMILLFASTLLVCLAAASPHQPHFRHQVPLKFNHTHGGKNVKPVSPTSDVDSDIVNVIRKTRQVSDNSILAQFPKIYKVDDFIIIANPKVKAPVPCTPQPVNCPTIPSGMPRPSGIPRPDEDDGFRLGISAPSTEEPSKCVWAIVACCSPGSKNIRYTCFELLGCPGAFWDVSPCEEKVVMAAANRALQFYSNSTTASK